MTDTHMDKNAFGGETSPAIDAGCTEERTHFLPRLKARVSVLLNR